MKCPHRAGTKNRQTREGERKDWHKRNRQRSLEESRPKHVKPKGGKSRAKLQKREQRRQETVRKDKKKAVFNSEDPGQPDH